MKWSATLAETRRMATLLLVVLVLQSLAGLQFGHTTLLSSPKGLMVANAPPVADAGPDLAAAVGESLSFDASASYDPDRTGVWSTATPLPLPIRTIRGSAVRWGDAIYVFGGATDTIGSMFGTRLNTTWRYDLMTRQWEERTPFPAPGKFNVAAVALAEGILVFGGGPAWRTDSHLYDPVSDAWSERADTPCLGSEAAAFLGGLVYALPDVGSRFCAYDPSADRWTELAPFHMMDPFFMGKNAPGLVAAGGRLYAIGGLPLDPSVVVYDPAADEWSLGPDMITKRFDMSVAVLHDRIYAIGGQGPRWSWDMNEEFDPFNGTWASREPMPTPRDEAAIVAVGDSLHVIGGSQYDYRWQITTHEVYTVSLQYGWDFGDGATANGKTATHAYSAPGVYTVTLTVTDLAGGVGTDTLQVTIVNTPPTADAGGSYAGVEGSPLILDASASYDPEGDPLTYRWDFDSDGTWDTSWSSDPTALHTWGDDFDGVVTVEVSDGTSTSQSTAPVHIENVPPTIDAEVLAYATGDLTLRVAGEKFHDVKLTLYEDGTEVAVATVYRVPGDPDAQAATIEDVTIDLLSGTWSAVVEYTPLDDPINGQVWGADPAWLIFTLPTGEEGRLHHTFNVRHEETWVWEVDDLSAILIGLPITFEAAASDPGSDDLTFTWSWDDGTPDTVTIYYNDGVGPDPYPSPEVNPVAVTDTVQHMFVTSGAYVVAVVAEDDDGGSTVTAISLSL